MSDDPGPRPIARIFDVDRLGVATYVLALGYIVFAASASFKLARVNKFLTHWNSQKYFHVFVVVHLLVRAVAFGILCFLSIVDITPWYPLLVMLFTLPEFFILSTYCLLFFHWLEIYVFSHEQFMISSKQQFRKNWKLSFLVITILLYVTLVTFYMILSAKPEEFEDYVVQTICYIAAAGCFALPLLMSVVACYFGVFVLAGFPFQSAIAKERVSKINTVMVVWTFGRVARGVIFILSVKDQWQTSLNQIYLSIVTISVLAVAEIFPFMLSLDWSMIGVLLLGEEAQKLRTEERDATLQGVAHHGSGPTGTGSGALATASHRLLLGGTDGAAAFVSVDGGARGGGEQKWDIDSRELKFTGEIKEESGISFSQRGTWNGRPVLMRAFRFQEMNSAMIDELVQELIDFSALDHPHISHFLGVARVDATVYQVNEYVARGSLHTIIQHSKKDFNGITILRLARELASAMAHLLSVAHVHGHLKSSCVLLDENMSVRLGDVGVRRLIAYAEVILVERSATAWSAPEVLDGAPATRASDVYSYGVVCWELLSRRVPYDGKSFADIRTAVLRQREHLVLPAHPDLPQPFNTLVSRCLDHNPAQRPSFAEINKALAAIVL